MRHSSFVLIYGDELTALSCDVRNLSALTVSPSHLIRFCLIKEVTGEQLTMRWEATQFIKSVKPSQSSWGYSYCTAALVFIFLIFSPSQFGVKQAGKIASGDNKETFPSLAIQTFQSRLLSALQLLFSDYGVLNSSILLADPLIRCPSKFDKTCIL